MNVSLDLLATICRGNIVKEHTARRNDMPFELQLAIDSRELKPGETFVCLQGERTDGHEFINVAVEKEAEGIILERNTGSENMNCYSGFVLQVQDSHKALLDIATYFNRNKNHILITGSAGKTTTRILVNTVLPSSFATFRNFNTPIGLPIALTQVMNNPTWIISELSASYPGEIEQSLEMYPAAKGAILTGIGSSHAEFFSSDKEVLQTKAKLFSKVIDGYPCLANGHIANLKKDLQSMYPKTVFYGFDNTFDVFIQIVSVDLAGTTFTYKHKEKTEGPFTIKAFGKHFVLDAVGSIVLSKWIEPSLHNEMIQKSLNKFEPGPGRGKIIPLVEGSICIDESYNANPLSMKMSLEAFKDDQHENKILIVGDMLELGDKAAIEHEKMGEIAKTIQPVCVIYVGSYYADFRRGFSPVNQHCFNFQSPWDVIRELKQVMKANSAIFVKASNGIGLSKCITDIKSSFSKELYK